MKGIYNRTKDYLEKSKNGKWMALQQEWEGHFPSE